MHAHTECPLTVSPGPRWKNTWLGVKMMAFAGPIAGAWASGLAARQRFAMVCLGPANRLAEAWARGLVARQLWPDRCGTKEMGGRWFRQGCIISLVPPTTCSGRTGRQCFACGITRD